MESNKISLKELKSIIKNIIKEENLLNESVVTDVDGITDSFLNMYLKAIERGGDIKKVDAQVYELIKKTIKGHDANPKTKKDMYSMLGIKLKNTKNSALISIGQEYSSMGSNM